MSLFNSVVLLYLLGALSGLIFLRKSELGKLFTGIFAASASLLGTVYGLRLLVDTSRAGNSQDALSAFFVLLISFVSLAATIYSFNYLEEYRGKKNLSLMGAIYNLFILAMLGVVTAQNMYVFLVAWETMSLASYFLVMTDYEKENVRNAGFIYVVMTHAGTAFITLGFLILANISGANDFAAFSAIKSFPEGIKTILFAMFFIGFGTKAGLIPLHIWLPKAHPVAPSHVSALMSGVMVKMAVYGFIRTVFTFLGADNAHWGEITLAIGTVSALMGVMYAVMQRDLKRLLAFSSVENIGIIFMALGVACIFNAYDQRTLATWAMLAALIHSFNHALFKALLFMGAGAIHFSTHTKNIEQLGGLIKRMPATTLLFLIGTASIAALPPLNGFIGEWYLYKGLFSAAIFAPMVWVKMLVILASAALALTGALAAFGFLKAFGVSFLALPRSSAAAHAKEAKPSMLFGMSLLAVACVVNGVFAPVIINLLSNVARFLTGQGISAAESISITSANSSNGYMSFILALLLLILFFMVFYFFKIFSPHKGFRKAETWTCGIVPTARMEYSATSFSQPLRIVFKTLLFPQNQHLIEGETSYFPGKIRYEASFKPVYEDYLYKPINNVIVYISKKIRHVQSGQIQLYVIYIFIALIFLLAWKL